MRSFGFEGGHFCGQDEVVLQPLELDSDGLFCSDPYKEALPLVDRHLEGQPLSLPESSPPKLANLDLAPPSNPLDGDDNPAAPPSNHPKPLIDSPNPNHKCLRQQRAASQIEQLHRDWHRLVAGED